MWAWRGSGWRGDVIPHQRLTRGSHWPFDCRCVWFAVERCCTASRSSPTGPAASAHPGTGLGRLQGGHRQTRQDCVRSQASLSDGSFLCGKILHTTNTAWCSTHSDNRWYKIKNLGEKAHFHSGSSWSSLYFKYWWTVTFWKKYSHLTYMLSGSILTHALCFKAHILHTNYCISLSWVINAVNRWRDAGLLSVHALTQESCDTVCVLTVSAPWLVDGLVSGLLLTHIDGETRLNAPETCGQRCFLSALCSGFTLGFIFVDCIFVVKNKTLCWQRCILMSHLPFMVLKRRIPSAGPQIWIRSSLFILKRSAPATAAEHLFSFHLLFKSIMDSCFSLSHSAVCLVWGFLTHYLWSWRRALRKVRTCDGAATAECPLVRMTAEGATCQKEEEPLKWV